MAEITAKLVAQLRGMTSAGLMDCKKALIETDGDVEAAVDVLRAQGTIKAAKKAGREANEGVIAHYIQPDSKAGMLVEVNCETDFVAKNEQFLEFTGELAKLKLTEPGTDFEELRTAQVAKIGENILLSRDAKLEVDGTGLVAAYIHTGAKVGVLPQVGHDQAANGSRGEYSSVAQARPDRGQDHRRWREGCTQQAPSALLLR